ncbi:MAG: serine/threonine-protein kinase [Acidimicrobiia bacterium]
MIADRYQPIEQIGTGGMATVWRARDTLLGRLVAVKRLLPHLARDPDAAARFEREARAAAGLSHPGIVTVFDSGEDDDGPFIVLELVEGTTLASHLAETGPLDPGTVTDMVAQVGSALDHAHAMGVIHRDIKPANLILDSEGRVRLADFGIARTVDARATITESGELVGTITYLAPEILSGDPATPASDVYSLGAVTFELLTGRPPFQADTPAALVEAVRGADPPTLRGVAPDQMASAVSAAMARAPSARPASAGEFAAGLIGSATLVMATGMPPTPAVATQSEEPTVVTSTSSGAPPPAGDPEPTSRVRWSLAALLLALLALAAAAMSDRPPAGTEDSGGPVAAEPTTSAVASTTTIPTTTTMPTTTTTTIPTTTTTVATAESVAGDIGAILALLAPPEFKPKEVRQVEDRMEKIMEEWENDNREDLIRELERAFEEVADLEESQERDELAARLIELAELMGFEVDQSGQGDGGGDDD